MLEELIDNAQSDDQKRFESALLDLRLIIERFTQNRYSEKGVKDYLLLFSNKEFINYRLNSEQLKLVKHFLFFALFNFPDRTVLVAKCIKVLFDTSVREAICVAIKHYMKIDDDATCELIFAITDIGDFENYRSNQKIRTLFKDVSKFGGKNSKEAVSNRIGQNN